MSWLPAAPSGTEALGALVGASPDFIALADLEDVVLYLNPAGRRLVGLPDGVDVRTTRIQDYLTPQASLVLPEQRRAVLEQGAWTGRSSLRRWSDGESLEVDVSMFAVADPLTGVPAMIATVQRDARSRSAAEHALACTRARLEQTQRQYRSVLQHLSDVLVVFDLDGRLQYASDTAADLHGFPDEVVGLEHLVRAARQAEAVSGRPLLRGPAPGEVVDGAQARPLLATAFLTPGRHGPVLVRLRTAAGPVRLFEVQAENLVDDPSLRGVVLVLRDVTERHAAQQALAGQARVLEMIARGEDLDATLGELARTVEAELPGTYCSIMMAQPRPGGTDSARVLRHAAGPSMPPGYHAAIDGIAVDRVSSPCSRAALDGEPVLVSNLVGDAEWEHLRPLAQSLGLATCWSFPVLAPGGGDVLGTFALFRARQGLPDEPTVRLVQRASQLVGIALARAQLESRLSFQATHDELTALPNRTLMADRLRLALARRPVPGQPVTVVLFLDLDRLKVVNDSLGHDVGDRLLVAVADRLRSAVRPGDTVSRFGGDEFVVIAEEADAVRGPRELAERVLAAVARPLLLEERLVSTSASIGVVVTEGYTEPDAVLRDADTAMYRAKACGGNRFEVFASSMRDLAVERMELEAAIRRGLERGEFHVAYQPVVDLTLPDHPLVGAEALVRWADPERGLLGPSAFMDVAEETGLIVPLGALVLRTAAREVGSWRTPAGRHPPALSVNVSLRQLGAPGLVEAVAAAMTAAAPWKLFLELTESTLLDDTAHSRGQIQALADVGAELSIDDFGTGYSCLSYLTQLPVSTLKIDRSFVRDLSRGAQAEAVVGAIIALADRLGLRVVAEGVEEPEQVEVLTRLGCRYAQGFLLHPPLDAAQARALWEGDGG